MSERDFQRALEKVSGARSGALSLAAWPKVGRVDLELPDGVGVELKWCKSGDTLANCSWDVAKLATALAEHRLTDALIAAGAPIEHWSRAQPGVELFDDAVYESDELIRRYESWWRFWCKDVSTRPVRLPTVINVADAGRVPVELDGASYLLRAARITVGDRTWRTHVCPHRWRGERCEPRPWDPDGRGGLPER